MINKQNPAQRAAGRAPERIAVAANTSEDKSLAPTLQHLRAAHLARRYCLAPAAASAIAEIAFTSGRRA